MTTIDAWRRPWAMIDGNPTDAAATYWVVLGSEIEWSADHAPIIVTDVPEGPLVDGKAGTSEFLGRVDGTRAAWLLPFPVKAGSQPLIHIGERRISVEWTDMPAAPDADAVEESGVPDPGIQLMDRVKRIWTRLREVEDLIADPATLWPELTRRWTGGEADERPKMDEIVIQSRSMRAVLDRLDKAPRRVLRRIHEQLPLSRVQELDRRSMTWLIRQPGETMAEQAGNSQRILGIAREENFNTLENRVLLAYAKLARQVAVDYVPKRALLRSREKLVQSFGRRCKTSAEELTKRGVTEAKPDVTPNFVLLNNPDYHAVWEAWRKLLDRKRIFDELWRWQVRSWDEFCGLAVMVALQGIDGAEAVATSPLVFRAEQQRGSWLITTRPLGVVHLMEQSIIAEVTYGRPRQPSADTARTLPEYEPFLAPIRIRCGRVGNQKEFLKNILVWPQWSLNGGLPECEASETANMLRPEGGKLKGSLTLVAGGIVIMPARGDRSELIKAGNVYYLTLGASGKSLQEGLAQLRQTLLILLEAGTSG